MWEFLKENYEGIIALAALFIAWNEAHTTRKHNRLSLRPSLRIYQEADHIEEHSEKKRVSFCLYLRNDGLGPAMITDIKFLLEGKDVLGEKTIIDFLNSHMSKIERKHKEPLSCDMAATIIGPSILVPAGEKIVVAETILNKFSEKTKKDVQELFLSLQIIIEYKSFYNEKFSYQRA